MFIFVFPASGRGPGTVQLHRIKQLITSMSGSAKDLWWFIGNIYNKITKYKSKYILERILVGKGHQDPNCRL